MWSRSWAVGGVVGEDGDADAGGDGTVDSLDDDLSYGAVDAFASDYVPPSLVEAAFHCAREEAISLPEAIAMISDHPAQMAGLPDRGGLETGMRGDVVRVHLHGTLPVVRQVWRAGERVI